MHKKIKEIDIKDIKIAIKETKSKRAALRYLGCNDANGNELTLLRKIANENGCIMGHHTLSFDLSKIKTVLDKSYGFTDVAKNLGLIKSDAEKISSRLVKKISVYIEENNLDISHFRYKRGSNFSKSDEEVFCNSSTVSSSTVKKRFLKLVDYKCQKCNISEWNGDPISLQMDHIDGNSHNHLFSNLRLLCPNCHSQTETFSRRNRKIMYSGYQQSKMIDTQK